MSLKDKTKWDKKYQNKPQLLEFRDASAKLIDALKNIPKGDALDLACGTGRNALYLAQNGFKVDALDIAQIALDTLTQDAQKLDVANLIHAELTDLDNYTTKKQYDLIVMCNFLDRSLLKQTKDSLKSGGFYFVETYMLDASNEKENSDKNNLLEKKELQKIFDDFEIVHYDEFDNEKHEIYSMKKQVILAKKI